MPNSDKITIDPPPTNISDVQNFVWKNWFNKVYSRISNVALGINGYSKASLPPATEWASNASTGAYSALIYVIDDVGGPVPAFSDGIVWRRVTDRNVIS